jgi:LAO/AO transport system kinase
MELVKRLLAGDRRAAARLITLIESDGAEARQALAELYPYTGRAHIVGVTGAPGAGKSTLVNELTQEFRRRGKSVGIIAVDASSPFSGGALLGDRVRMQELSNDPGVFIRSMASRGSLGGLAWATSDAVKVLDAFGKEVIFVETVGAGQAEVDIARAAHTTVVVAVPGLGDDIQASKAGILEIADVFAVNKADLTGADNVVATLQAMLDLGSRQHNWRPPVLRTIAVKGEGIAPLADAIQEHGQYLRASGRRQQRERERLADEVMTIVRHELMTRLLANVPGDEVDRLLDQVVARRLDPYSAARLLMASL